MAASRRWFKEPAFAPPRSYTIPSYQYCRVYNNQNQKHNLGHITPVQALKNWQQSHPHLFKKAVYNSRVLTVIS